MKKFLDLISDGIEWFNSLKPFVKACIAMSVFFFTMTGIASLLDVTVGEHYGNAVGWAITIVLVMLFGIFYYNMYINREFPRQKEEEKK